MAFTKELLEEAKTLAEPFKSQELVEQHIKEKYGSFENFNKERQALGIDPSLGTYQAMLKVDSAKVAPLYQKYGVEQPATDAPFSEKANAFLEVFGRESDEIIEKQQKILNDLYKTIRIINPQKDTIDTSQKNLTNNYPLVEPFKFPIN